MLIQPLVAMLPLQLTACSAARAIAASGLNPTVALCRITVNFSMQLTHIIRETRYLDRMTFTIPEYVLNVTLQEDRYLQCVDGLTDMLERYYKVCSFRELALYAMPHKPSNALM